MTLRTVLLSLQALLASPEPDDPQDAVVARQCKEKPQVFYLTAQHWSNAYAGGNCFFKVSYRQLHCFHSLAKVLKVSATMITRLED